MATVSPDELKKRKIGRVLTKLGKVSREQVHEALAKQRQMDPKSRKMLGEILSRQGEVVVNHASV